MSAYEYVATDCSGLRKTGVVSASSLGDAQRSLRISGFYPSNLMERWSLPDSLAKLFSRQPDPQEMSDLCREASMLLANAVPLDRTLSLLALHRQGKLGAAIRRMEHLVLQGYSLGQAMQGETAIPALMWQTVRSAEMSGNLSRVFEDLSEHFEITAQDESKVKATLFYPKVIVVFALFILVFILTFLMPSYIEVYVNSEMALPTPTRILVDLTDLFNHFWFIAIPFLAISFTLLRTGWRRLRSTMAWESFELSLPVLGALQQNRLLAQLCRTLAMLLQVGIPLDRVLLSCEGLPQQGIWRDSIQKARQQVVRGVSFAEAMDSTDCFPDSFIQLLLIGSEGGDLLQMLPKAAGYYTRQANTSSEKLLQLLQPIIMLGVALLIGALAVSLLLPLYNQADLVNSISGMR